MARARQRVQSVDPARELQNVFSDQGPDRHARLSILASLRHQQSTRMITMPTFLRTQDDTRLKYSGGTGRAYIPARLDRDGHTQLAADVRAMPSRRPQLPAPARARRGSPVVVALFDPGQGRVSVLQYEGDRICHGLRLPSSRPKARAWRPGQHPARR